MLNRKEEMRWAQPICKRRKQDGIEWAYPTTASSTTGDIEAIKEATNNPEFELGIITI